ncbi:MAG: bifunctional diguanylate cyclase/phosphodiesterase [Lachnospiraceae bacterium]|nr:bifunctional diguanylate cyclase/phosphodiesterase [Lachnospiraceae bacterium]
MDDWKNAQDDTGMVPDAIDPMTGFLNRSGFYNSLTNLMALASIGDHSIVLLSVKLVNYKRISLLWEKSESDSIIGVSAKLIAGVLRGRAVCGRIAEDTYLIAAKAEDDGITLGNSMKEQLGNCFDDFNKVSSKDYTLNPVISFIQVPPDSGLSTEEILVQISSKSRDGLDSKPQSRYTAPQEGEHDPELRTYVNRILDTNDIDYSFQPIISAKTGEIIGYEALMRMPEKYGVSPLTLLKYATIEKRLNDVERATLFNVMKKMTELEDALGDRKVFINSIPGHYLSKEEFFSLSDKYSALFDRVVIEVTEETDMEADTVELLSKRSREYGFQVAVDDFGTGYSNVTNLLKFLPNYVKIDRFLISDLHLDPRKQHFVDTIIQFAHDNGFQALAEGVETSEELSAVIRMGADLIQGYYTGRPQPALLQALPQQILSEISRANLDIVSNHSRQKVFLVTDEKQLSLVDLSLQKYNILLLSGGDLTLVGNPEFVSAVSIRVKDHSKCRLTIRNVSIGDVDTTPCIDLGQEASLVLNIEGSNLFTGNGIRVPGSAELKLEGAGDLIIKPTFTNAYGIGNDYQGMFGRIISEMSGILEIDISGENCVSIGGRSSVRERAIDLRSGVFKGICAASNSVCIGSYQGKQPIYISDMDVTIDVRVDTGTMIGSMYGEQDTHISKASLRIFGAGNKVTAIGSTGPTSGAIDIRECGIDISLKGWEIAAIGAAKGDLAIECSHCTILIGVEGNIAEGIGCRDGGSDITIDNASVNMSVSSANGVLFGCRQTAFHESMDSFTVKLEGITIDRKEWFVEC